MIAVITLLLMFYSPSLQLLSHVLAGGWVMGFLTNIIGNMSTIIIIIIIIIIIVIVVVVVIVVIVLVLLIWLCLCV